MKKTMKYVLVHTRITLNNYSDHVFGYISQCVNGTKFNVDLNFVYCMRACVSVNKVLLLFNALQYFGPERERIKEAKKTNNNHVIIIIIRYVYPERVTKHFRYRNMKRGRHVWSDTLENKSSEK